MADVEHGAQVAAMGTALGPDPGHPGGVQAGAGGSVRAQDRAGAGLTAVERAGAGQDIENDTVSGRLHTDGDQGSDRLLTAQETADRLGLQRKTLYNWASTWAVERRGPEPLHLGVRLLRYRESEVDQYIESMGRAS